MAVALAAGPMLPRPFIVEGRQRETADTVTLTLKPGDGGPPVPTVPGQFNMLYAFGIGEVPVSASGGAESVPMLVHTIRGVGAVTRDLIAAGRGATVGVRGPFGSGWPLERAAGHDVVILAGGIGLAPLRPAIRTILADRRRYGRLEILYGARTPQDILYRRELERWRSRRDARVEITVDRAGRDWYGSVGVVSSLIGQARFDPAQTLALVCGPEAMMRFAVDGLRDRGVEADRIYLSMERNMRCAAGFCGHCQFGPFFVCRDGPVFRYDRIARAFAIREL
jgi:NAD(P)H-flavin reductase